MNSGFKFGMKYVVLFAIAALLARLYFDWRDKKAAA
jgi:hypothetical protein